MDLRKAVAGAVLAGSLTMGAAGMSGVAGAETTRPDPGAVKARICAHEGEIEARLAQIETRLGTLTAKLTDARGKAEAAGRADLVARIDTALDRIAKIQARLDAMQDRLAKACAST